MQRLADEFWQLWKREYLALLQSRRVWQRPQKNLQVGDVVLVHDQNACRTEWDMGRVMESTPGDDGSVRKVKMIMATSSLDGHGRPVSGSRILERPVHKVTVLVSDNDQVDND